MTVIILLDLLTVWSYLVTADLQWKITQRSSFIHVYFSTCGWCIYPAGVGWARAVPIVRKCLVLRIAGSTGCTPTTNYGGCDQICLPSGNNNQKRCACATGFVLKSDGTECEGEYSYKFWYESSAYSGECECGLFIAFLKYIWLDGTFVNVSVPDLYFAKN